jgi:hypothetical protein
VYKMDAARFHFGPMVPDKLGSQCDVGIYNERK